jgi:hypothetical protein
VIGLAVSFHLLKTETRSITMDTNSNVKDKKVRKIINKQIEKVIIDKQETRVKTTALINEYGMP